MASYEDKVPQNVPGKYYVDHSCIYCDVCRDAAPEVFAYFQEMEWAYVYSQPRTPEEEERCREAMVACPTESIGDDGER